MRKILVSLLVVSMLLGLVGTAAAAAFSDTTDGNVLKATAYGWVGGYADGTFKPEGNITRAEAAKMIVMAMGLKLAADAAKGLAPKFSDVPASHWASGFINVCVSQGVLKGYADGTFKPEANITGAEIVTMIVRGLKRENEAVGDWPVGHITVAATNDIIDDTFAASALATRVDVAKWLVNASAVKAQKLTADGWVADKTWIENDYNVVTGTVEAVSAEDATITVAGVEYDLATGYAIAGGKTLTDLVGRVANLTRNIDDDEIVYAEIKTNVTVKTGTVDVIGANYFYIDGDTTKYTVGLTGANLNLIIYRNGIMTVNKDIATLVGSTVAVDDTVEFYASSTNVVTYIKSDKLDKTNQLVTKVTSSVTPNSIEFGGVTYYVPSTAVIKLNGAAATLADIKKDMYVSASLVPDEDEIVTLAASNAIAEGKATAVRTATTTSGTKYYVTIGGSEYRLILPDLDAPADGMADECIAAQADALANKVTLYLDLDGVARKCSAATSSTPYAKVVSFELDGTTTDDSKWVVDIKGVSTTYLVDDADHVTLLTAGIAAGDYVKLAFTGTGKISAATTELVPGAIEAIKTIRTSSTDSEITFADDDKVLTQSKAVVYINGAYKTIADLEDDQSIKFALDGGKIAIVVGDTVLDYNGAYVISPADNIIKGVTGAVEKGSVIKFYSNVLRTVDINILAGDVTIGADGVAGDNALTATDGVFEAELPDGATTVYVTITDTYGNTTNANWTVTR